MYSPDRLTRALPSTCSEASLKVCRLTRERVSFLDLGLLDSSRRSRDTSKGKSDDSELSKHVV